MMKLVCSLILWLTATNIHAEVTSKGETGFKLKIIGEVAVTPNEAYEQFINIDQWWLKSHTWYGDSSNLRIDPGLADVSVKFLATTRYCICWSRS